MDYTALIARMDEQRAQWLDIHEALVANIERLRLAADSPEEVKALDQHLADAAKYQGLRLRFLRPLETDTHGMRVKTLRDVTESSAEFVVDWSGFTEATLLGAAVGSDQVVPFHRPLFVRWLRDRTDVVAALGEAIKAAVDAHVAARDQSRKN